MTPHALRTIAVLQALDDAALARLATVLEERDYAEGQTIFGEGDPGDGMYFIVSGTVHIEKRTSVETSIHKTLAILEPGDYFGEMLKVVSRDYKNLLNRFISLGPNFRNNGLSMHGTHFDVDDAYDEYLRTHPTEKWGGNTYPSLQDDKDVCDAILHFAANALVGESMTNPAKYFRNNVASGLNLVDAAVYCGVKKFVFSSTCATYGVPPSVPITEDMPQDPISPYGRTKLAVEWALRDSAAAWGLGATALRYFTASGADPDTEISERHDEDRK